MAAKHSKQEQLSCCLYLKIKQILTDWTFRQCEVGSITKLFCESMNWIGQEQRSGSIIVQLLFGVSQECFDKMTDSNGTSSVHLRGTIETHLQVFVLIIILVTTVIGNSLVLIIISLDHRLHCPGFYFLANLSVADLILGTLYNPFYISSVLHQQWQFHETWCKFHAVSISTSFNASIATLCFVSLDRFVAITKPLRYLYWKQKCL
jgi:hypothetical protein